MVVVFSGCIQHVRFWQVIVSLRIKLKALPDQVSLFDELAVRTCRPVTAPQRCPSTTLSGVTLTGTRVQCQSPEHHLHVPLRIHMLSSNCNTQETCHWTVANGISEKPADKSWGGQQNNRIEFERTLHLSVPEFLRHCWEGMRKRLQPDIVLPESNSRLASLMAPTTE